ncbi:hypothetical protein [Parapedobacter sp. ISTM3]
MPFSVSHDDRIGNGIALCPNMHRAFLYLRRRFVY